MSRSRGAVMVLFAGLAGAIAPALQAQAERAPEPSPRREAKFTQGLTLDAGWWSAGRDPAGVSPGSAPMIAARYDVALRGASSLYVQQRVTFGSRRPIDPARLAGQRALGRVQWPLSITDVGIALRPAAGKAWYGLLPVASVGVGIVSDGMRGEDVGGYAVGTQLALSYGAGVHWVASPEWRLRAEIGSVLHRYRYPDAYFTVPTPVLANRGDQSGWRSNLTLQIGVTRQFARPSRQGRATEAEVGSVPERSPYRDAPFTQGLTLSTGWWNAGRDPAGVSPGSAPMVGARYDWSVGDAGSIYVQERVTFGSRLPIDPYRVAGQRALGRYSWPLSVTDVGFTLLTTGQKTWRGIIPVASAGIGVVTDWRLEGDVGGYDVGTQFALSYGAGIHWVTGTRWRVRAEIGSVLHRFRYPDVYVPTVLPDPRERSGWRSNLTLQLGVTRQLFR